MYALQQDADKIAVQRVSYLVDMVKAKALDALGENQTAIELMAGIYKPIRESKIYNFLNSGRHPDCIVSFVFYWRIFLTNIYWMVCADTEMPILTRQLIKSEREPNME